MLDVHDPSGPCSLTTLDLTCTGLTKADLGNLLQALNATKISHCTSLYLSKNTMTGYIKELFVDIGLPFVETLNVSDTSLNGKDLLQFLDAMQNGKLPKLKVYFFKWYSRYG